MRPARFILPCAVLGVIVAGALAARAEEAASGQFDPPVRLKVGEAFIDTADHVGHAGPLVVDLNADGRDDLLVGNFRGHFQVYRNVGTRAEPVYEDGGLLGAGGEAFLVPNW
jgi:hypothetical protein